MTSLRQSKICSAFAILKQVILSRPNKQGFLLLLLLLGIRAYETAARYKNLCYCNHEKLANYEQFYRYLCDEQYFYHLKHGAV